MKEDVTPKSHGTMMTAAINLMMNLIPRILDSYSFCCSITEKSPLFNMVLTPFMVVTRPCYVVFLCYGVQRHKTL